MSDLTDKIAAAHELFWHEPSLTAACRNYLCGMPATQLHSQYSVRQLEARHVAEVTEAAVRAQIAADIQRRKRDLAEAYAGTARAMLEGGMEEAARIAEGSAD